MPSLIFPVGQSSAVSHCVSLLSHHGIPITDHPCPEVTHLLLDVPSFSPAGPFPSAEHIKPLLETLPDSVTIIGGNLPHKVLNSYRYVDLLQDEFYLAQNAAITAHCALFTIAQVLPFSFQDSQILILGWGRIGKCLSFLLKGQNAIPTIFARNAKDRAIAEALGFCTLSPDTLTSHLSKYQLIINTIPEVILDDSVCQFCQSAVKVDLASSRGILSDDCIWARGLPGKYAAKSSGALIAKSTLRLCPEVIS